MYVSAIYLSLSLNTRFYFHILICRRYNVRLSDMHQRLRHIDIPAQKPELYQMRSTPRHTHHASPKHVVT